MMFLIQLQLLFNGKKSFFVLCKAVFQNQIFYNIHGIILFYVQQTIHTICCTQLFFVMFCFFLFAYLAIIPHKLNAVSRVNLAGAEITYIDTHFDCLNYFIFAKEMFVIFLRDALTWSSVLKRSTFSMTATKSVKSDF